MNDKYSISYSNNITKIRPFERLTLNDAQAIVDDLAENYETAKRLWSFRPQLLCTTTTNTVTELNVSV